jgi:hypothetical protein
LSYILRLFRFDEVPDARPRLTGRRVARLRLAVESLVQLASQVAEDLLGSEGEDREAQQSGKQFGQDPPADEDDVRGVLGLVDDPIVTQTSEFLEQEWIDLAGISLQDLRPGELGEAIGAALSGFGVGHADEGVVDLLEGDALLLKLSGRKVVAVRIRLNGERRPGRQANVDQSEFLVDEVVVKHALRHLPLHEDRLSHGAAQLERGTSFDDAQDADQPFDDRHASELLLGPAVLVDGARMVAPGA